MTEEPSISPSTSSGDSGDPVIPDSFFVRSILKLNLCKSARAAILISVAFFWGVALLPLVVLTAIDGTIIGNNVHMPLVADAITLTRYLVVVPILILSDLLTKPWLARVAKRFLEVVDETGAESYRQQIKDLALRIVGFRRSTLVNLLILGVAIGFSSINTSMVFVIDETCWQATFADGRFIFTTAGYWNSFVSQPIFKFVIFSWLLDYLVWSYFLFKVSRLPLKVISTHPDGVGGLSFLRVAQTQFCLSAFAFSCAVCSMAAQTVHYAHVKLQSFSDLGLVYLLLTLVLFAAPLLLFTPTLVQSKLRGVFSYGALSSKLCHQFAEKWLNPGRIEEARIVESTDPSSLCDMNGSYQAVVDMKPTLIDRQFVLSFVVATALPSLPLVASVMPLKDLFKQILQALT